MQHKCRKCQRLYEDDDRDDNYETGLCYACFEDGVEDYEERRRERIARENEW